MVFYDAGANIGFFTLIGARLVGKTGCVVAFEPEWENAMRLRENAYQNGFSSVTVVESALHSHNGKVAFRRADAVASPDRGTGRVVESETAKAALAVRATTLDDSVKDQRAPDVLKIDVLGAEVEVLRGVPALLQFQRPVIICEVHSPECDMAIRQILEEHRYSVRRLDENHVLEEPERL